MGNCASTKSVKEIDPPEGVLIAEAEAAAEDDHYEWKIMAAFSHEPGWNIDVHHSGVFYWYKKQKENITLPDSLHAKHNGKIYEIVFEEGPPSQTRKVKRISPFDDQNGLWVSYVSLIKHDNGLVNYVSNGTMLNCIEHYDESSATQSQEEVKGLSRVHQTEEKALSAS